MIPFLEIPKRLSIRKDKAGQITRGLEGVKSSENNLIVKQAKEKNHEIKYEGPGGRQVSPSKR